MERIDEYCRAPQEAAAVVPGSTPEGWPSKGEVRALRVLGFAQRGAAVLAAILRAGLGVVSEFVAGRHWWK